jgi:hypothetical protein
MRNGWLDANNLQFSKDRIATMKGVAADRLVLKQFNYVT